MEIASAQYPRACWMIALHHHVVEYPRAAKRSLGAHRDGFDQLEPVRLQPGPMAGRVVLMHGHRHIDWIGECAAVPILSAPSPVMETTDDLASYFYIHTWPSVPTRPFACCPRRQVLQYMDSYCAERQQDVSRVCTP